MKQELTDHILLTVGSIAKDYVGFFGAGTRASRIWIEINKEVNKTLPDVLNVHESLCNYKDAIITIAKKEKDLNAKAFKFMKMAKYILCIFDHLHPCSVKKSQFVLEDEEEFFLTQVENEVANKIALETGVFNHDLFITGFNDTNRTYDSNDNNLVADKLSLLAMPKLTTFNGVQIKEVKAVTLTFDNIKPQRKPRAKPNKSTKIKTKVSAPRTTKRKQSKKATEIMDIDEDAGSDSDTESTNNYVPPTPRKYNKKTANNTGAADTPGKRKINVDSNIQPSSPENVSAYKKKQKYTRKPANVKRALENKDNTTGRTYKPKKHRKIGQRTSARHVYDSDSEKSAPMLSNMVAESNDDAEDINVSTYKKSTPKRSVHYKNVKSNDEAEKITVSRYKPRISKRTVQYKEFDSNDEEEEEEEINVPRYKHNISTRSVRYRNVDSNDEAEEVIDSNDEAEEVSVSHSKNKISEQPVCYSSDEAEEENVSHSKRTNQDKPANNNNDEGKKVNVLHFKKIMRNRSVSASNDEPEDANVLHYKPYIPERSSRSMHAEAEEENLSQYKHKIHDRSSHNNNDEAEKVNLVHFKKIMRNRSISDSNDEAEEIHVEHYKHKIPERPVNYSSDEAEEENVSDYKHKIHDRSVNNNNGEVKEGNLSHYRQNIPEKPVRCIDDEEEEVTVPQKQNISQRPFICYSSDEADEENVSDYKHNISQRPICYSSDEGEEDNISYFNHNAPQSSIHFVNIDADDERPACINFTRYPEKVSPMFGRPNSSIPPMPKTQPGGSYSVNQPQFYSYQTLYKDALRHSESSSLGGPLSSPTISFDSSAPPPFEGNSEPKFVYSKNSAFSLYQEIEKMLQRNVKRDVSANGGGSGACDDNFTYSGKTISSLNIDDSSKFIEDYIDEHETMKLTKMYQRHHQIMLLNVEKSKLQNMILQHSQKKLERLRAEAAAAAASAQASQGRQFYRRNYTT